jgi:hypothetical protein
MEVQRLAAIPALKARSRRCCYLSIPIGFAWIRMGIYMFAGGKSDKGPVWLNWAGTAFEFLAY